MTAKGITAFYPTISSVKLINGKRKVVTESRLPNHLLRSRNRKTTQTFCLRQRKPPISSFLLSLHPHWQQYRQDSIDSYRLSDGKPKNCVRFRGR